MELKSGNNYLVGLKSGDEKIFKMVMDTWYTQLFNFANGYLLNEENSKEVVQDVFLQLWDNRKKLAENTVINAYLFTLTRNRCIDIIRRERLLLQFRTDKQAEYDRLTEGFHALSDTILDNIFASELQEEIDQLINSLPEQCRKVFILSRSNGLKNREISDILNLSLKTVESHMTKALKTIRNSLEKKFPSVMQLVLVFLGKKNKVR